MSVSTLLVFLIGIHLTLTASLPDVRNNQPFDGIGVHYRCVQNGTIALTFGKGNKLIKTPQKFTALCSDDGPHEDKTPGVLDILHLQNVPATFFIVGWRLHLPAAIESLRRTYSEV